MDPEEKNCDESKKEDNPSVKDVDSFPEFHNMSTCPVCSQEYGAEECCPYMEDDY